MSIRQGFIDGVSPTTLQWSVRNDIFYVEIGGCRDNPQNMAEAWIAIARVAQEHGYSKILAVDRMDDAPLEGNSRVEFVTALDAPGLEIPHWAFVARSAERLASYEKTQLDVAVRGISIRVFNAVNEAELWLRFIEKHRTDE